MNDNLTLLSFSEALNRIKNKETEYMIRTIWLKSIDFVNRIIIISKIEHIIYSHSCVSGKAKMLWHYVQNNEGGQTGSYAKIDSDDILADDWLDMNEWKIAKNTKEYEEMTSV